MDISALLQHLETLTKNPPGDLLADDVARRELRDAARNLSIALETPGDAATRIGGLPLQSATARIGIELNLFKILADNDSVPVSAKILAEQTGVEPILMSRLLKYFASFAMIEEVDEDQYIASNITKTLASPKLAGTINWYFDGLTGPYFNLPKFLRETSYRNISNPDHCPWHLAHQTTQPPFLWLQSQPAVMSDFMTYMTAQRESLPTWLEGFPFEQKLWQNVGPETPLFVDIGGAAGHQCVALKGKFPHVPGRIILQDLPAVIKLFNPAEGIEPMSYDFWTPQPIKGARAYYMRNIMHDWSDDRCVKILQSTMSAMTADSVILIDEMIIPRTNANWRTTQLDITMMVCLASQERTREQWDRLLDSAGLKIVDIYTYCAETQDSIIVAVPQTS